MVGMGDGALSVAEMLVIRRAVGMLMIVVVAFNHEGVLSRGVMLQDDRDPSVGQRPSKVCIASSGQTVRSGVVGL